MRVKLKMYGRLLIGQIFVLTLLYFLLLKGSILNYVITMGLLLLSTSLILALMMKNIWKPIDKIYKILSDFDKGNGDLSIRCDEERSDELGKFVEKFNSFLNHIEEIIIKANITSEEVAKNSKELSDVINLIIKGNGKSRDNIQDLKSTTRTVLIDVENQTASTEEISASITEISRSLSSLSENAEKTMNLSNETSNFADVGRNHWKKVLKV